MFGNFSLIHSSISPRILIEIKWFLIIWILLWVLFPNLSISLIFHLNSSSDLIEFQRSLKNSLISSWIRPLFTTILFNLWLFHKIGEFGIIFDMNRSAINERIDSFRHPSFRLNFCHVGLLVFLFKGRILKRAIAWINHDCQFSLTWQITVHHRIILKWLNLSPSSE